LAVLCLCTLNGKQCKGNIPNFYLTETYSGVELYKQLETLHLPYNIFHLQITISLYFKYIWFPILTYALTIITFSFIWLCFLSSDYVFSISWLILRFSFLSLSPSPPFFPKQFLTLVPLFYMIFSHYNYPSLVLSFSGAIQCGKYHFRRNSGHCRLSLYSHAALSVVSSTQNRYPIAFGG